MAWMLAAISLCLFCLAPSQVDAFIVGERAPVLPTFTSKNFEAGMTPSREDTFGSKNYCWRFALAQAFGIPRNVFDNVLKKIQRELIPALSRMAPSEYDAVRAKYPVLWSILGRTLGSKRGKTWDQQLMPHGNKVDQTTQAFIRLKSTSKMMGTELQTILEDPYFRSRLEVPADVRSAITGAVIGAVTNYLPSGNAERYKARRAIEKQSLAAIFNLIQRDTERLGPNQRRACTNAQHAFVMLSDGSGKVFYADSNGAGMRDKEVMSYTGDEWTDSTAASRFGGWFGGRLWKTSGKEALATMITKWSAKGQATGTGVDAEGKLTKTFITCTDFTWSSQITGLLTKTFITAEVSEANNRARKTILAARDRKVEKETVEETVRNKAMSKSEAKGPDQSRASGRRIRRTREGITYSD